MLFASPLRAAMLLSVFVAIVASAPISTLAGQGVRFEKKSWDKIQAKALKENKIIFVDAYTTWCGPCIWMSKNVFTEKAVGNFYNQNFINYKIDVEKGEGLAFAEKYKVRAYPTLLFINGDGQLVHQQLGAAGSEDFLALGKVALDPDRRIGEMLSEYESGNRESEFLREYVNRMISSGIDPQEAATVYFNSLDDKEFVTKENFELVQMLYPPVTSEQFQRVVHNREAFYDVVSAKKVDKFIKNVAYTAVTKAIYYDDKEKFEWTIKNVESMELPYEEEIVLYAQMKGSWADGDYPMFIEVGEKYMRNYAWDDWNELNTMAWEIYEDTYSAKDYLMFALDLAKRSVELDENYYNADTYAALLYKTGSYEEAEIWAEKAIKHAKKIHLEPDETRELLNKIRIASQ